MDNDAEDNQALDAVFAAAHKAAPVPSPDFMARLVSDAEAAMPQPETPAPTPTPSVLSRLKGLFAASGLTGAAALAVWIGFVMPETLSGFTDGFSIDETISLGTFLPGADLLALSE